MEGHIVNTVRSTSTHVPGRALNSAGVHHFVIDGTSDPHEEITPVDAFLASISACAVHLVERFAAEANVPLQQVEVDIEGSRPRDEPHRFEYVSLSFMLTGVDHQQAAKLVERFKGR
jgi:uncharacterized OsmC-like protein